MALTPEQLTVIGLGNSPDTKAKQPDVPTKTEPVKQPAQVEQSESNAQAQTSQGAAQSTFDTQARLDEIEEEKRKSEEGMRLAQQAGISLGQQQTQAVVTNVQDINRKRDEQVRITQDAGRIIDRTQRQIDNAENLFNSGMVENADAVRQDIEKAKQDLNQYKSNIDAITNPALTPYINFTKDGGYSIDVQTARERGVPQQLLYDAGVEKTTVMLQELRAKQGKESLYISPEQAELKKKLDVAVMVLDENRFKRLNSRLPDSNWIAKSELQKIKQEMPEAYRLLRTQGYDAYNEYVEKHNANVQKQIDNYNQYLWAVGMVEPYKSKDGKSYEIVSILQSGNDRSIKAANLIFDKKDIDSANTYIKDLKYADVGPEMKYLVDKGVPFAQRIIDLQLTDKKMSWPVAGRILQKDYPEEYKEWVKSLETYNKELGSIQTGKTIAVIKAMPNTLVDAFVPFKATVQNWNKMSPLEQGASLAGDIGMTILYAVGIGQAIGIVRSTSLPFSAMNKAQNLAKASSKANKELQASITAIRETLPASTLKTGILTRDIAPSRINTLAINNILDDVAKYRALSIKSDTAFINQLGKLKTANAADLKYLEKLSGMKGLKSAMLDASKAAKNLEKAWAKIPDKLSLDLPPIAERPVKYTMIRGQLVKEAGKSGYYFRDFTPDDLFMRYQDLKKAQAAYDLAMGKLRDVVKVRFTEPPPADIFKGYKIISPKSPTGKPNKDILDEVQELIDTYNARQKATKGVITKTKIKEVKTLELKPQYETPKVVKAEPQLKTVRTTAPVTKPLPKDVREYYRKSTYKPQEKPIDKPGAMTPEQLARYYGVQEAVKITSKPVSGSQIKLNDVIYPKMKPSSAQDIYLQNLAGQRAGTEQYTRDYSKSIEDIEAELKTELQPQTEVKTPLKVKTVTDVNTKTIESIDIKPPKVKPLLMVDIPDSELKKLKKPGGKICWRQGFGWWVIKYPYKTEKDMYFTRKKPAGAYDVKGVGSAYRTIQALSGNPQILLTKNLGIVDVTVKGTQISFKRKKNRTAQDKPAMLKGVRR
jgi:hypothetical protein